MKAFELSRSKASGTASHLCAKPEAFREGEQNLTWFYITLFAEDTSASLCYNLYVLHLHPFTNISYIKIGYVCKKL